MKAVLLKIGVIILVISNLVFDDENHNSEDFQGKAYYFAKSKMDLGKWGSRLSEAQKKQVAERLRNRLEKTYLLIFNKEESLFEEEDKLDAISGATDTWGKNFSPGKQYKNIKTDAQIQNQEFYGKKFLVKDKLQSMDWKMSNETKVIGNYTCFKATTSISSKKLNWYSFSWNNIDEAEDNSNEDENSSLIDVEAWYSPEVPVGHGPLEFWGLPGLILEVSYGNTTLLCSKLILNPKDRIEIITPEKGKVVSKKEYQNIITEKMIEFRNDRMRRRN